jgi:hypothetical protein
MRRNRQFKRPALALSTFSVLWSFMHFKVILIRRTKNLQRACITLSGILESRYQTNIVNKLTAGCLHWNMIFMFLIYSIVICEVRFHHFKLSQVVQRMSPHSLTGIFMSCSIGTIILIISHPTLNKNEACSVGDSYSYKLLTACKNDISSPSYNFQYIQHCVISVQIHLKANI